MSFYNTDSSTNSESSRAAPLKHSIMESSNVFEQGPLPTQMKAHSSSSNKPPKPLLVVYPSQPGEYPLLIFFPGFVLPNIWYRKIFQHVASHGYIIVAPQMYAIPSADATEEIEDAVKLTEWLPTGLSSYLPQGVEAVFQKMVVAGHSRGGKVAFGAALGRASTVLPSSVKYSAIIGVDPVDGRDRDHPIPPPILSFKPNSFRQGVPVLVIGSGTPNQSMSPDGVNHRNFFEECCAPAYHFVVETCRHLDFLDDSFIMEAVARLMGEACQVGEARQAIRSFTGGIMVAFLKGCVNQDYGDLNAVLADPSLAPVAIEPPQEHKSRIFSRL